MLQLRTCRSWKRSSSSRKSMPSCYFSPLSKTDKLPQALSHQIKRQTQSYCQAIARWLTKLKLKRRLVLKALSKGDPTMIFLKMNLFFQSKWVPRTHHQPSCSLKWQLNSGCTSRGQNRLSRNESSMVRRLLILSTILMRKRRSLGN